MPIGLLTGAVASLPTVTIKSGVGQINLSAELGNPTGAITYQLIVSDGVVCGATDYTETTIDGTTLHEDSIGYWFLSGKILGAGGTGGTGWRFPVASTWYDGGGGGGGAGHNVGAGGPGAVTATNGANGTQQAGGAAGVDNPTGVEVVILGSPPTPGGHAVELNHAVIAIINGNGQIGGGGQGGEPGPPNGFENGPSRGGHIGEPNPNTLIHPLLSAGRAVWWSSLTAPKASFSWSGTGSVDGYVGPY